MARVNENYLKLPGSYLFSRIAQKINEYQKENPDKTIVRLGIGDVTRPLTPSVIEALHKSVDEMADEKTFRGYAPDLGYEFLRSKIAEYDYKARGCDIAADEIFVSDGAKTDSSCIQEIFAKDSIIAVCDPVYPVYVDSNIMAGRGGSYDEKSGTWSDIVYMPCVPENDFTPQIPSKGEKPDLIYLCFPNNPTGTVISKEKLQKWVDYALSIEAVIIFDAAYEAYIAEENVPHSIYECKDAKKCAIELKSFSKTAGFTGLRLGYAVVPKELDLSGTKLHALWARRHGTKFNGAPYIVQRAGEAIYSEKGQSEVRELVAYYMENARAIREDLTKKGFEVYGGVNAPYIWLKTSDNMTSWEFFDYLLHNFQVVGTPGAGFGPSGEHFFRLTAFGSHENTLEALRRIR